jgi:hypothetical protein
MEVEVKAALLLHHVRRRKNELDGIGYIPCSWNVPQEVRSIRFTVIYVNTIVSFSTTQE